MVIYFVFFVCSCLEDYKGEKNLWPKRVYGRTDEMAQQVKLTASQVCPPGLVTKATYIWEKRTGFTKLTCAPFEC